MILRLLCIILSLFALSGCSDGTCLDADDFGFAHFVVPARYPASQLKGQSDNQVAPWLDTGYVVNGTPLVMVVKNWNARDNSNTENELSAWCPWYGGNSGATGISSLLGNLGSVIPIGDINSFKNGLSKICQNLAPCQWSGDMCTNTVDAQIVNAPCLMTKGVGLYALVTGPGANPNLNTSTMANPSLMLSPPPLALHLGEPQVGYTLYDVGVNGKYLPAGGVIYNYSNPSLYNNGKLYFKILDKHYGDNSGQYLVTVKSGLNNDIPDPIQFVTNMVAQYVFGSSAFLNNPGSLQVQSAVSAVFSGVTVNKEGIVPAIYKSVIQNPFYKNCVRGLLSLYVIFTGLYYLAGLLHITKTEIIARIIKIAIVATLLDPNLGWSFFHDNLFVFFVEGVQQIIGFIQTAAATGPGPTSIISLMIAPQTIAKLMALLFTSWFGVVYIVLYFLIFLFITVVTFRAAVLYLNCLIMIGMMIIMGPIFICFMLFGWTKSLFENWLRQLTSYVLQPIILITSLAFISILVRHEIYTTLGFPVCREYFLPSPFNIIDPSGTASSIFSWWFPAPMDGKFSGDLVTIPVPEAHSVLDSSGNKTGVYCEAYACNELRYPQLPFLDPNSPTDMVKKRNFFTGSFTQILGLIYLIILCYLMNKFNSSAVTIAKALSDTSGNSTNLNKVTNSIMSGSQSILSSLRQLGSGKAPGGGGRNVNTTSRGAVAQGVGALGGSLGGSAAARGGLAGSKDDGSGTKSPSSLTPKSPGLDKSVSTKPLDQSVKSKFDANNQPKNPIQGGKKGSVDDSGVKYRDVAGPKKTLAEVKADLLGKNTTATSSVQEALSPVTPLASSTTDAGGATTSSSPTVATSAQTPPVKPPKPAGLAEKLGMQVNVEMGRNSPVQSGPSSTPQEVKIDASTEPISERKVPPPKPPKPAKVTQEVSQVMERSSPAPQDPSKVSQEVSQVIDRSSPAPQDPSKENQNIIKETSSERKVYSPGPGDRSSVGAETMTLSEPKAPQSSPKPSSGAVPPASPPSSPSSSEGPDGSGDRATLNTPKERGVRKINVVAKADEVKGAEVRKAEINITRGGKGGELTRSDSSKDLGNLPGLGGQNGSRADSPDAPVTLAEPPRSPQGAGSPGKKSRVKMSPRDAWGKSPRDTNHLSPTVSSAARDKANAEHREEFRASQDPNRAPSPARSSSPKSQSSTRSSSPFVDNEGPTIAVPESVNRSGRGSGVGGKAGSALVTPEGLSSSPKSDPINKGSKGSAFSPPKRKK